MRASGKLWTPEDDETLRKEALASRPVAEIAKKLGRSESAVRARAYILRVMLRQRKVRTT